MSRAAACPLRARAPALLPEDRPAYADEKTEPCLRSSNRSARPTASKGELLRGRNSAAATSGTGANGGEAALRVAASPLQHVFAYSQAPIVSPCARCAGRAFRETRMVTNGFVVECVW